MPNALLLPFLDLLYENFHHPIAVSSLIQSDIPEPISTAEVLWKEKFPWAGTEGAVWVQASDVCPGVKGSPEMAVGCWFRDFGT